MNHLLLGAVDKTEQLLDISKPRFLLLDDGPIADAFLDRFPKARLFDPLVHSLNPLAGMDYKRARDFADILYTASPGGKDTLTVRNGRRALVRMLLAGPKRLSDLPTAAEVTDDAQKEALGMVEDLLVSPVLRRVLCGGGKAFRAGEGTTVAKLDRAVLGDFDAFIFGSLLIGQHKGQIVVPDFGFYGRPLHVSLIREDRLTAGLNFLDEVPRPLAQALLTIPQKTGRGCIFTDAELLASYAGLIPTHNDYNDFVHRAVELREA